jgi:protein tyrosine/serine phosphatase
VRLDKIILTTAAAVGIIGGSYAGYCGLLIWSGNHHTVAEGQLYRSAQLTATELGEEIDAHHIRTVLNLRGPNPAEHWYQEEIAATRAHGAAHYDVGISAQEPVASVKIEKILAVLRDAPKPILVHCRSGADRTGFVAALYRYAILGQSVEAATQELSMRYGHFPYLISKSGAMDESARVYFLSHLPPSVSRSAPVP